MRFKSIRALSFLAVILLLSTAGCDFLNSEEFLEREPNNILLEEQVWNDPKLAESLLANYYNRLPQTMGLDNISPFAQFDEAMWSGYNNDQNNITNFGFGSWGNWDYNLIRHINLFIEKVSTSEKFTPAEKTRFVAEGRFLRAYMYFELVKRMGGVPLITKTYTYDFSGDPSYLALPRAKESEVYDFIAAEVDTIANNLPEAPNATRATKWTALALKSRAMLYAGSLAKYNNDRIMTPGREVGIDPSLAPKYYQAALEASEAIIAGGKFALYNSNPNKGENFFEALTKKSNNPEVIWAKDFTLGGKFHNYTYDNIPRSLREDNENSSILSPSLNLVEAFEYTDGRPGTLVTKQENGDYVYYDNPADIFANKDARLWGTVIYPEQTFKGKPVSIQAGVMVWDAAAQKYNIVTSNTPGDKYTDGKLMVGFDGPLPTEFFYTNTGFFVRKWLDPKPNSGQRGVGSDIWWVKFRYAEVLLNAAEAAFELNQKDKAAGYINQVRARGGIAPLAASDLTLDRFVNERRVEFAFEDHRLWDLKRWRLADKVWNGDPNSANTMMYALWPYRVVRPGSPEDGKYVFVKKVAPRFVAPRFFREGNYYSEIGANVLSANPKIVKNPFH